VTGRAVFATEDKHFDERFVFDQDAIYDKVSEVLACLGDGLLEEFVPRCKDMLEKATGTYPLYWARWSGGEWSVKAKDKIVE
jgi:hypothetical protein